MAAPKLTIAEARDLPFEDLIMRADEIIESYAPAQNESEPERIERLSRTVDEMPDIYRWFLTLHSFFDHWTDAYSDQFGNRDTRYKQMRERRDAMERAASAAKMRYQGSSRVITVILGHEDEGSMPRTRR